MRIEENSFSRVRWCGDLGPRIENSVATYSAEIIGDNLYLAIFGGEVHASIILRSLPHLLNFYRDLGDAINNLQPGLTLPLPDGDPSEVDAMQVIYEADRLRKGIK